MSIVTQKVALNVLEGIIALQETRRNLDSSSDERRCINLTPELIEQYTELFKYNGGNMSDGKYVQLNEVTQYLRVPVNIHMVDQNVVSTVDPEISTIEQAAKQKRCSLQVYVDGLKIPDHEILFYPTKSNVDVLVPDNYINKKYGSMLIVEKRRYDLYDYLHVYEPKAMAQTYSVDLSSDYDVSKLRESTVQVYINKQLYNIERRIKTSDSKLIIEFTQDITASELEIIVDPYIAYYFPSQTLNFGSDAVFEIPESYIDSIHGPVSRFSCSFFINGKRIPNTEVYQSGRLHFLYATDKTMQGNLSIYLSDREYVTDTDQILYGSDYSLYNFVGCDKIKSAITTGILGNKYLDPGATKQYSTPVTYAFGAYNIPVYLPKDLVVEDWTKIKLTISGKEVKPEDVTWDDTVNPIKITVDNPGNYLMHGTSGTCVVDIGSWFTWDEVLNKNGELFDRQKIKECISLFENGVPVEERVATMLLDRPYLMRTFLENYGYKKFEYEVEYDGVSQYIYAGIPDDVDVTGGKEYDVSVNSRHVPSSDLQVISKDQTDIFKINAKFFTTGKNTVEIQINDSIPIEYQKIKAEQAVYQDGVYLFTIKDKFKKEHLGDVDQNFIILERIRGKNSQISRYVTDWESGYRMYQGEYYIAYDENENAILVVTTELPTEDLLVYNKNFSQAYKYTKPVTSSSAEVVIPIYTGYEDDPVPFIPRGKILVYCGSDKLIEGVDYFIKTPANEKTVGGTFMIMKRKVLPGSTVDIYFSNLKTTTWFDKTGYLTNNRYGLVYFDSLKFPFSLKYMNLYVSGKKMTESDVDILSDKLVRIHSVPVPMYDIAIETAFTCDYSEIETFINEYAPDNFERYLAHLFTAVAYDRDFDVNEQGQDVNDVYETFLKDENPNGDQFTAVDSVNRRPNPVAREGEWIPSYNEDPNVIGPHSMGEITQGNDINCSLIFGNTYVVGADKGKVASCIVDNELCAWTPCDYDGPVSKNKVFCNGEPFTFDGEVEDITACILYNDYIVFGTYNGHIVAYDTVGMRWLSPNTYKDIELINNRHWPEDTPIFGFVIEPENNILVAYGGSGNVDSYTPEVGWNGHDMESIYTPLIGATNVMGDIFGAKIVTRGLRKVLVVFGREGKACSCYFDNNAWCDPFGNDLVVRGKHPAIYNDGKGRKNSDIYAVFDYIDYSVCVGKDGVVSLFNNKQSTFSFTDNLSICDDGTGADFKHIFAAIGFEDSMIFTGGHEGNVSQYSGDNQHWYASSTGNGITDAGKYMSGCDIYTMQLSSGNTHYVIFAGEQGKVCSYNIDVSEVPFRYDPYKTSFLKWYTTAGNAIIQARWDVPEEIARMFDMYAESEDHSGNVVIRGGDSDMMEDIDMNDNGEYPWTLEARRRFLANFIKDLPEGRYSPQELYDIFMEGIAKHMLYEEDLVSIAAGDKIDRDEDMDITSLEGE